MEMNNTASEFELALIHAFCPSDITLQPKIASRARRKPTWLVVSRMCSSTEKQITITWFIDSRPCARNTPDKNKCKQVHTRVWCRRASNFFSVFWAQMAKKKKNNNNYPSKFHKRGQIIHIAFNKNTIRDLMLRLQHSFMQIWALFVLIMYFFFMFATIFDVYRCEINLFVQNVFTGVFFFYPIHGQNMHHRAFITSIQDFWYCTNPYLTALAFTVALLIQI